MNDTITLLKKQIKVEKNKKNKVDMLYELACEYLSINTKKSYSYAKKAYYTSKSIDYEDGIKNNIAFYLTFNNYGVIDKEKLAKYVDAENTIENKKIKEC